MATHTTKDDCWVVVNGEVLDVTNFLPDHPGGELAILTFAGKDASEEFNMIHPPDVIGKYAPDAVLGPVGAGGAGAAAADEAAANQIVVAMQRQPINKAYEDLMQGQQRQQLNGLRKGPGRVHHQ